MADPQITQMGAEAIVMPDLDEPWSGPCDGCGKTIGEDDGGECDICGDRLCVTCYAKHPCTEEQFSGNEHDAQD